MTTLIRKFFHGYQSLIANDKYADPRTKGVFIVSSPLTLGLILASYLYFCTKCGPQWMAGRKPFELKKTLLLYNALQVLFSCYMAWEGTSMWLSYDWFCEPLDLSYSPKALRMVRGIGIYFYAKLTELLDTVFFVLRKKNEQISFLHLYHHTIMPLGIWFGFRYFPAGGHGTLLGVINSYVHIVMYTYYLIAGLGPEYQKYLWWKKHLTTIQLVQFGVIFLHNLFALLSSCDYPKIIHVILMIFTLGFIYLFGSFFLHTYVYKNQRKNKKS